MLYILPNPPGGRKSRRRYSRKSRTGRIATRGPGLPTSMRPTVWRPPARRAHPASKKKAGRKIQKALGKGKWFRHRIVFWSKKAKGGDEGVRTPYYVKGNAMARRRRSRYGRKGRRRNSSGLLLTNRPRRRRKSHRRGRRNPFVLGNRKRRRSRRSRRNTYFTNRPRRRRHSRRSRRNPFVLGNRKRRRSHRRRNTSLVFPNRGRRHRRGHRRYSRRNPGGALTSFAPGKLLSVGGIKSGVVSLVKTAIPVGLGYAGGKLFNTYVWSKLGTFVVTPLANKITNTTGIKALNSAWFTLGSLVSAGVGAGLAVKVLKRRDAAALFAAGVAVQWLQGMANYWLPEGAVKDALSGYGTDTYFDDYVEYALPGRNGVSDYVEATDGAMSDYVEAIR